MGRVPGILRVREARGSAPNPGSEPRRASPGPLTGHRMRIPLRAKNDDADVCRMTFAREVCTTGRRRVPSRTRPTNAMRPSRALRARCPPVSATAERASWSHGQCATFECGRPSGRDE